MGAKHKIIVSVLIASLLLGTFFVVGATTTTQKTTMEITFSSPTIFTQDNYSRVTINEQTASFTEPGKPMLPLYTIPLTFPVGTKIHDVNVVFTPPKEIPVQKKIIPVPQPVPLHIPSEIPSLTEDPAIYTSEEPFPQENHEYRMGIGIQKNQRTTFLTIYLYPVRYIPIQEKILYNEKAQITITYTPSHPQPIQEDDQFELVIITPQEYTEILEPLIPHKENRNITTKMVALEEIPSHGNDDQEDIKYFIKDAIETWNTKYILLVGGAYKLPARFSNIPDEGHEDNFPSDLYYADIYKYDDGEPSFASWDANDDQVYGEHPDDRKEVDLYPDVYLGRLACSNKDEVSIAVNKIINYELTNVWTNKIIVIGGDTFPGDDEDIDEGEYANQQVLDAMPGITAMRIWASGAGDRNFGASAIKDEINMDDSDFVDFSGHGSSVSFATHPHGKENIWRGFKIYDIQGLTNTKKLPIVVLNACSCNKFTAADPCFGWAFMKQEDGGAIAVFGASGIAYGSYGSSETDRWFGWFELNLFRNLYSNRVVGEVWADSLTGYINTFSLSRGDYKTVEEMALFGDPTLTKIGIPNDPPQKPTLEGPSSGKTGKDLIFTATTTDPDDNFLFYLFDWGDGTTSTWLGPYESGDLVEINHNWSEQGTFAVRVKAKDEYEAQSEWSDPLSISLPKTFPLTIWDLLEKLDMWFREIFGRDLFTRLLL